MFYDAEASLLYLPQKADYTLDLQLLQRVRQWQEAAENDAHKPMPMQVKRLTPETSDSLFRLPEGPASFGATLADGRRLEQQVFVDGTPPELNLRLEANSFSDTDTLYYGPPQRLRFEAFDEASGVEEVRVSVNQGPFIVHDEAEALIAEEGFYALRFYAVDRVGNVSEIQEESFVLDLSPPELEMTMQGDVFENRLSRASFFSFGATDARSGLHQIFYRISARDGHSGQNDAQFAIYDAEVPVSLQQLAEGRYFLEAFATNRVGLHSDTLTYAFVIDDTPPELRAEADKPAFQRDATLYISPQTPITLHAEDALSEVARITFGINAGGEYVYEAPFTLQQKLDEPLSGLYSISYQAKDAVRNESNRDIFRVFLDPNPPEISYSFDGSYTAGEAAGAYSLSPETRLVLLAEDLETGQASIAYRLEYPADTNAAAEPPAEEEWQPYNSPLEFRQPGRYTLAFRAADPLKNRSETLRLQLEVREGGQFASTGRGPALPEAVKTYFRTEEDERGAGSLTGPLSEPVYLFISDAPEAEGMQLMLSDVASPEGAARRFANEGLQQIRLDLGMEDMFFQVTTDGTPPRTTLLPKYTLRAQADNKTVFNTDAGFRLEASDNIAGVKEIFYSIDGQAYQPYSRPIEGFIAQKEYMLRYYAIDRAGNEEEVQEFLFTIDATPPRSRLEMLSDFSGSIVSPHTRWAIYSSDNTAGVAAIFFRFNDESEWQEYSGPKTFEDFYKAGRIRKDEVQQLHYFAVDKVGNEEAVRAFSFRMQTRPPAIAYAWEGAVVKRGNVYVAHPDARLRLSAQPENVPVKALKYGFSPQLSRLYEGPLQLRAEERGSVFFAAEDEVANRTAQQQIEFLSDAAPPRTRHEIVGPRLETRTGLVLGPAHEVRLRARDSGAGVAQTRVRINERGWQTYRDAITLDESGSYTLSYTSTDAVGNEEQLNTLSFRVDVTPPDINVIYSRPPSADAGSELIRLAPGTVIAANATDRHTELETLRYQLGDGPQREYSGPIGDLPVNEPFELRFIAIDLLGNKAEKSQRYIIETL